MEAVKQQRKQQTYKFHRCAHPHHLSWLHMTFQLLAPQFWANPRFHFPLLIILSSGECKSRAKPHLTPCFPVALHMPDALRQIQQAVSNTWLVDCACADRWLTNLTHSTNKVHELLHIFHQTWLLYLMSVAKSDAQILHFLVSTRTSRLIICFPINCTKHWSIRSSYKSIII